MNCDICNSKRSKNLFNEIVKCSDCGHVYAKLKISNEELKKLYKSDYFDTDEYHDYKAEVISIKKNFQRLLKIITKFTQNPGNKTLVEVGSAYGYFVDEAQFVFKKVIGTEIAREPAEYASKTLGLDVRNLDILDWNFDNQKIDIVCLWDVIEHLYSPNKYLNKISESLDINSLIALTTPDIGSLVAKIRKENWRQIHPPTHIHYFNKETITHILKINGFEVIHYGHFGRYRTLGMIFYIIFVLRIKMPIFFKLLEFFKLDKVITYLNLYDEMIVIAKKVI